jgi:peptidoglycan/LPS O-acetylase OafA/YrhL
MQESELSSSIKYRSEIDGLRALAVLPVIFFHSGMNLFSGGFVGVDIFFVISGYLITSIILRELTDGSFSILNFYERRVRRILPALFFVIISTMSLGWMLLPPIEMQAYLESIVSVLFFSSNIYFWRTLDYFSPESEYIPLLHTWSLGVEEQFYIFFPLAVIFLWKWKTGILRNAILLATLSSLLLCIYLSATHAALNFYTLPSRAWELLAGSIASYILFKDKIEKFSASTAEIGSAIGLALIVFSIFYLDQNTNYPSELTILPVFGSFLVIIFAKDGTNAARILSWKPLVWIGLVSYSAYLWHQPVLSFFLIGSNGIITNTNRAFLIALILLISFLTWRYIERPFRQKDLIGRDRVFQYSAATSLMLLLIAFSGIMSSGFEFRFSEQVNMVSQKALSSPMRSKCHTSGLNYLSPSEACTYSTPNAQWAVLGDSHGVELSYALAQRLETTGVGVKHLTFSACAPEILFTTSVLGCHSWMEDAVNWIKSDQNTSVVVLAFNHIAHEGMERLLSVDTNTVYGSKKDVYFDSVKELAQTLTSSGKRVVIMLPVPKLNLHINYYLYPKPAFLETAMSKKSVAGIPVELYISTTENIRERLTAIAGQSGSELLDPMLSLCDEIYCYGVTEDIPNYFDEHHMSVHGASLVVRNLEL